MSDKQLKELLTEYGKALNALPEYHNRHLKYPKDQYAYEAYKEQLTLVQNLEEAVKSAAKKLGSN